MLCKLGPPQQRLRLDRPQRLLRVAVEAAVTPPRGLPPPPLPPQRLLQQLQGGLCLREQCSLWPGVRLWQVLL